MQKDLFLEAVAEIIGVEELSDDLMHDESVWDSIQKVSVATLIQSELGEDALSDAVRECYTIKAVVDVLVDQGDLQ